MAHAILSPSASSRWMQCPASVRMTRDTPSTESVYAREGTAFHTLCENLASKAFLSRQSSLGFLDWAMEAQDEWIEDQLTHSRDYLALLRGYLDEEPEARLFLEERVDAGVPGSWGTADAIIVYSDRIRVIDIKYGSGVRVSALNNSQLRLYGAGALSLVSDPLTIKEITTTVWQPRMNNLSEETLTRSELSAWIADLIPVAKVALGEDAPFGPSETACRFCPIAGECKPRADWMLAQDFGDPNLLDGAALANAVSRTADIKRWLKGVEEVALKRAYEDAGSIPGYKLVLSGGRRTIPDGDAATAKLVEAGYSEEDVSSRKLATFEQLDKLLGAEKLQRVLGDLLVKSEGRLSLAKESDSRPPVDAIHSAKTDFAGIEKGEA